WEVVHKLLDELTIERDNAAVEPGNSLAQRVILVAGRILVVLVRAQRDSHVAHCCYAAREGPWVIEAREIEQVALHGPFSLVGMSIPAGASRVPVELPTDAQPRAEDPRYDEDRYDGLPPSMGSR